MQGIHFGAVRAVCMSLSARVEANYIDLDLFLADLQFFLNCERVMLARRMMNCRVTVNTLSTSQFVSIIVPSLLHLESWTPVT